MLAILALLPLLALANAAPAKRFDKSDQLFRLKIKSVRDELCLSVDVNLGIGAPIFSAPCAEAYNWTWVHGDGDIFLDGGFDTPIRDPESGKVYAIDFGPEPVNGGSLTLQLRDGSDGQKIYYTTDNRLAHTGGTQCFDEGDNGIQTWQCTDNNPNQEWDDYFG